jgi:hypothetical protein
MHSQPVLPCRVVLALALLVLCGGCPSSEKTNKAAAEIRVSAVDLCKEYEANVVAADEKYRGKVIVVSGQIEDIGKTLGDTPELTLASNHLKGVVCQFFNDQKPRFADVSKGKTVSIKGKCAGKVIFFDTVVLQECVIE